MKINYQELLNSVSSWDLREESLLFYKNLCYGVFYCTEYEDIPVEWDKSSEFSGADIYVWNSVPKTFLRPIIAHEILEFDLFSQEIPVDVAHLIALKYDERIARDLFDVKKLNEYLEFKEDLIQKFS